MTRRLFTFASVVSLVLWVRTVAIGVRSFFAGYSRSTLAAVRSGDFSAVTGNVAEVGRGAVVPPAAPTGAQRCPASLVGTPVFNKQPERGGLSKGGGGTLTRKGGGAGRHHFISFYRAATQFDRVPTGVVRGRTLGGRSRDGGGADASILFFDSGGRAA
jgi:hypothetical protein